MDVPDTLSLIELSFLSQHLSRKFSFSANISLIFSARLKPPHESLPRKTPTDMISKVGVHQQTRMISEYNEYEHYCTVALCISLQLRMKQDCPATEPLRTAYLRPKKRWYVAGVCLYDLLLREREKESEAGKCCQSRASMPV